MISQENVPTPPAALRLRLPRFGVPTTRGSGEVVKMRRRKPYEQFLLQARPEVGRVFRVVWRKI